MLDSNRAAVSFCFGEAAAQLHLTEREIEVLTLDAMANIWKVRSFPLQPIIQEVSRATYYTDMRMSMLSRIGLYCFSGSQFCAAQTASFQCHFLDVVLF